MNLGLVWVGVSSPQIGFSSPQVGIRGGSPGLENPSRLPDWRSRIGSGLASTTQIDAPVSSYDVSLAVWHFVLGLPRLSALPYLDGLAWPLVAESKAISVLFVSGNRRPPHFVMISSGSFVVPPASVPSIHLSVPFALTWSTRPGLIRAGSVRKLPAKCAVRRCPEPPPKLPIDDSPEPK